MHIIEKRSSDALELFITEQNIKGSKVEYDKNELAAKLKVSSVTAARLLKTLAKNGYLEENQKVKPYKYSLTASGTENKANSFVLDEIISEYTVFYQNDLKKL